MAVVYKDVDVLIPQFEFAFEFEFDLNVNF